MSFRGLLLGLFAVPVVVGGYFLTEAATADGTPRCDGIITEYGDAERSGPMKPGETCDLYDFTDGRSAGTRTYAQQQKAQDAEATRDYWTGGLWLAYGVAGLAVVTVHLGLKRRA
ncbi:hypothetical protein BSZ07_21000 [Streptomyces sp. M1013]|uniref:hypothetical protein n=1 Tax=Streptomyces sp. M1013 TaxID=549798 RepID=UPI000978FC0E|nr:hypothetical protein [Streptomyces sp. M1013]OMI87922.1 hypothetical protein BSZ07_21000 [Streptomyces sp. M1013]